MLDGVRVGDGVILDVGVGVGCPQLGPISKLSQVNNGISSFIQID